MNSIFLDSFTYRLRKSESGLFFHRWDGKSFPKFDRDERLSFLFNILSSLLIHDKIIIKIDAVEEFIELMGYSQFIHLINESLIEILDDSGAFPTYLVQNNNYLTLLNMSSDSTMTIDSVQKRLDEQKLITNEFDIVNKSIVKIDGAWFGHLAEQELYSDFGNKSLTDCLQINSVGITDIEPNESFMISRLLNVNRSLIYMHEQGIGNVHLDGFSKIILNQKFQNNKTETLDNSIDLFSNIIKDKDIPDFSLLYLEKKLNLDTVLKIRNNFNGGKFRDWYNSTDYDRHLTYKELLKHKEIKPIEKGVRFFLNTTLGLLNPVAGIVSGVVDSYLIDKVLRHSWTPNLFLDNILKRRLDKLK